MPQLRVLISTSTSYPPSTLCPVNSAQPVRVKTDKFDGEISVFVKDFDGEGKDGDGEVFFGPRAGETYGIVVRGRFLDGVNADDVVFGNVFERPIKESLPWGTAIATKFMYFVDPTLELDVYADKPWALSPVVSTMKTLSLKKVPQSEAQKAAKAGQKVKETFKVVDEDALGILGPENATTDAGQRRKYFGYPGNREEITLDKDVEVGMEFSNGILDFNTLSAHLPRPFTMSFPLLNYWDGQPVIYVCRKRVAQGEDPTSPEGVYWSVAFEIVDEEAKEALEKKGKSVLEMKCDGKVEEAAEAKPFETATAAPAKPSETAE